MSSLVAANPVNEVVMIERTFIIKSTDIWMVAGKTCGKTERNFLGGFGFFFLVIYLQDLWNFECQPLLALL